MDRGLQNSLPKRRQRQLSPEFRGRVAEIERRIDFDQIQRGVRNGAPRVYGWVGAFGIMVTVVWLYVEILRLIAIVRGNN